MRVVVFQTTDETVPPAQRCVARLRAHFPAAGKRKAGEDWCPVVFHGPTLEEVRATADAWVAAEAAKERAKAEARERAVERLRQARQSKVAAQ